MTAPGPYDSPLAWATFYTERRWAVVPVPAAEKKPDLTGWQNLRLSAADLPRHFNGQPQNIGLLLGAPSEGLVDVDLDAAEAIAAAPAFLPLTGMVHGRRKKPSSHYWYEVADPPAKASEKFSDPMRDDDRKSTLVELRSSGGQTLVPPSTQPSDMYAWERLDAPARITRPALERAVALVASAALLGRYWPAMGTRHDVALALGGFLLRGGLDVDTAARVVEVAARIGGSTDPEARAGDVRDTARRMADHAVTGAPTVAELLPDGERITRAIGKWLGFAAAAAPTLTDTGNAQRFVAQHGEDLRFVWAWHTWLRWDGLRWRRDAGDGVMRMAKETARAIYQEAARERDDAKRKAIATWAAKSESEPALRRMLVLAQSEPGIPVTPDQLDTDLYLLNTPTGTLELRTLHLRSHRRGDLITKITAASYVPAARHPVFDAYRARLLGGDVDEFLARAAGYTLTGDTSEEVLFFAHGPTATGKTTLTKAIAAALGDYAATADFSSFLEGRRSDGPRNDLARLAGARMVLGVEVQDGSRLAEGLLKLITGGDRVTARFLYGEHFEYTPQFKLWLVANDRPRARDTDEAFWRRLLEVPFTESLPEDERDPAVKATLCDPAKAGPAILAWAADGAAAWFASGLRVPDVVRRASQGYRASMDLLADFLADCCVLDTDAAVSTKRLREAYETWARETGMRPISGRGMAEKLEARGCERVRRHAGERWWVGLRLREAGEGDSGDTGDSSFHNSSRARAHRREFVEPGVTASPASPEPDWVRGDDL